MESLQISGSRRKWLLSCQHWTGNVISYYYSDELKGWLLLSLPAAGSLAAVTKLWCPWASASPARLGLLWVGEALGEGKRTLPGKLFYKSEAFRQAMGPRQTLLLLGAGDLSEASVGGPWVRSHLRWFWTLWGSLAAYLSLVLHFRALPTSWAFWVKTCWGEEMALHSNAHQFPADPKLLACLLL